MFCIKPWGQIEPILRGIENVKTATKETRGNQSLVPMKYATNCMDGDEIIIMEHCYELMGHDDP